MSFSSFSAHWKHLQGIFSKGSATQSGPLPEKVGNPSDYLLPSKASSRNPVSFVDAFLQLQQQLQRAVRSQQEWLGSRQGCQPVRFQAHCAVMAAPLQTPGWPSENLTHRPGWPLFGLAWLRFAHGIVLVVGSLPSPLYCDGSASSKHHGGLLNIVITLRAGAPVRFGWFQLSVLTVPLGKGFLSIFQHFLTEPLLGSGLGS